MCGLWISFFNNKQCGSASTVLLYGVMICLNVLRLYAGPPDSLSVRNRSSCSCEAYQKQAEKEFARLEKKAQLAVSVNQGQTKGRQVLKRHGIKRVVPAVAGRAKRTTRKRRMLRWFKRDIAACRSSLHL